MKSFRPPGRPTDYTAEIVHEICERLTAESIANICKDEHMPHRTTVWKWRTEHADFDREYRIALSCRIEDLADECIAIADDASHDLTLAADDPTLIVNREVLARTAMRLNERHWLLAKLLPSQFGDQPKDVAPAFPLQPQPQPKALAAPTEYGMGQALEAFRKTHLGPKQ